MRMNSNTLLGFSSVLTPATVSIFIIKYSIKLIFQAMLLDLLSSVECISKNKKSFYVQKITKNFAVFYLFQGGKRQKL